MKVLSSLKSAKNRHPDCQIVRRKGKVFVICKSNPRFKARQGQLRLQRRYIGYLRYYDFKLVVIYP